jgi:hypothetical protein
MRTLIQLLILFAAPVAAFAQPDEIIPEPETLSLLAIGAVAMVLSTWRRKK